jgi:transcriptional regulator with XRE-family HTH domain
MRLPIEPCTKEDFALEIGTRIRRIRLQQGRTIQEVATLCNFSKGLLSKIETGKIVPAIATLTKIARVLGIKVSVLMEEGAVANVAVTPDLSSCEDAFVITSKGYSIYGFAPHFLNKKMQPLLINSQKNIVKQHSVSHEGEEFIYVLEGSVKIHVGNTEYLLEAGESIYFEALNEHGVMPVTDKAIYLDIFV